MLCCHDCFFFTIIVLLLVPYLLNHTKQGKALKKRLRSSSVHGNAAAKAHPKTPDTETIRRLEQQIAMLRNEKETTERDLIMLRQKYDSLMKRCQQLENTVLSLRKSGYSSSPLTTTQTMDTSASTSHTTPSQTRPVVGYAFGASSLSPYGFFGSDFTPQPENRPFVINFIDDRNATLSLQTGNPTAMYTLFQSLSYYDNLIDYTIKTNMDVTKMTLTSQGELHLLGEVWTVKKKISVVLS